MSNIKTKNAGNPLRKSERERDPYDGLRPWSAITHALGVALSILGTLYLVISVFKTDRDVWKIVSFLIYGASMVCLYTASTLYHSLRTSIKGRMALKKYDHISIYFLIAGTYTPMCLVVLRGKLGWWLFGIIFALAIAGTVTTLYWVHCPRWFSSGVYIGMGWIAIFAIYPIWQAVGWQGITLLLAGGLVYTVGGVFYALKWPWRDNPRFGCHEFFHVLILVGSAFMFAMMASVVLPY